MTEYPTALARATTRSAEGWPRIAWTNQDLDRMVEIGLLGPHDRVELIDGEIVPMPAKGIRHERVRRFLVDWMYRRLPVGLHLLNEPGWRPESRSYLEPDVLVVPASRPDLEFPGTDVLLAIEIADSSLSYDTSIKRDRYAYFGVPEYWVVHAGNLTTRVYREPGLEGYPPPREFPPDVLLVPAHVPEIAVRLVDLGIG